MYMCSSGEPLRVHVLTKSAKLEFIQEDFYMPIVQKTDLD
jgi:hypothetical protein